MYEYIQGEITELNPAMVIIEAGGIGYAVHISLNTFSALKDHKQVRLFTHLTIREDAHLLFGFAGKPERDLFRNLITVSGVGVATALTMLSSLSPDEIVAAISGGNIMLLKSVKGIGIKTAQRIIIDLKDKIVRTPATEQFLPTEDNTIRNEALSALVMLGFARKEAETALAKIIRENPGAKLEALIKLTLKRL